MSILSCFYIRRPMVVVCLVTRGPTVRVMVDIREGGKHEARDDSG